MKKILVILTQPIEDDSSSMLTARGVIATLAKSNIITCVVPYCDKRSIYYNKSINGIDNVDIIHYGDPVSGNSSEDLHNKSKQNVLIRFIYNCYKKIDLFGYSITYLKHTKFVLEQIKNNNFDILLSFSDPKVSHLMANKIKKKNPKVFYVQHWGDPLLKDITCQSKLPKFIKKRIEFNMLKRADKIVYVSPLTLKEQKALFPTLSQRMTFIPTPGNVSIYNEKSRTENLVLGYCGSYNSSARNIIPLYEAASAATGVELYIIGNGDVDLKPTPNIHIVGRVSKDELSKYIELFDVLVSILNKSGAQIPAKIYIDGLTNKESLVLVDGDYGNEIKSYFSKYNRYIFVDNDVDNIQKGIVELIKSERKMVSPVLDFEFESVSNKIIENIEK